jgi:formamidopyrimidine-DNA glycosylase
VVAALRARRTEVKRALLDQTLLSGVGNIYADESLWRAAAARRAARPARLTRPAARALLGHVADVMREAMRPGGTSFDALYVNVNGESGYFDRSLAVYGREGEALPALWCAGCPGCRS